MTQRKILSDNIISELENMITGTLKPGDKLPTEMELSERFSVGRSTLRESMKVLVAKGLVERTTEGTFVSENVNRCLVDPLNLMVNMEIGNVRDLLELRQIIELGAIRIAAKKIGENDLLALRRINWQLREPGASSQVLQERDIEFHSMIAQATGNKVLAEFLNAIRRVAAQNIENGAASLANIEEACHQHQELIEALEAHDSEKAYTVLLDYFNFNEDKGSYSRL